MNENLLVKLDLGFEQSDTESELDLKQRADRSCMTSKNRESDGAACSLSIWRHFDVARSAASLRSRDSVKAADALILGFTEDCAVCSIRASGLLQCHQ